MSVEPVSAYRVTCDVPGCGDWRAIISHAESAARDSLRLQHRWSTVWHGRRPAETVEDRCPAHGEWQAS